MTRSTCTINEKAIMNAIDIALADTAMGLAAKMKRITPRDPKRPPKSSHPTNTGNLQGSIKRKKKSRNEYRVGVVKGGPEYAKYQEWGTGKYSEYPGWVINEFGTRHMKARPYIRKAFIDNYKWLDKNCTAVMKKELRKYFG